MEAIGFLINCPHSTIGECALDEDRTRYQPMIRDLPAGERPRERLRDYGAGALNTAELVAILLRVGTQQENVINLSVRLLTEFGGLVGIARAPFAQLAKVHGIGEAKASQLKAALEIAHRLMASSPEERAVISSPQVIANLLMGEMAFLSQESLRVVLLNTRNQVMAVQEVSRGTVNASQMRVSEVFRGAVLENHPALIVVHNHPSGDPTPSGEDAAVTAQLVEAGQILDIEVLDHVVIGEGRFVSMREKRLGFS